MNHADLIGKIAGLVALIAAIPYIRSMIKGETRPNRASWFIWMAVSLSILVSYHFSGATSTIWLTLSYTIIPVIVFLLSFKYGEGGLNRLDIVCIIGALLGLLLWKVTSKPEVALYLNIVIDVFGFIPTIKKAYLDPKSENRFAWTMSFGANVLNLFAITNWELRISLLPIYSLCVNGLVTALLYGLFKKRARATVN